LEDQHLNLAVVTAKETGEKNHAKVYSSQNHFETKCLHRAAVGLLAFEQNLTHRHFFEDKPLSNTHTLESNDIPTDTFCCP